MTVRKLLIAAVAITAAAVVLVLLWREAPPSEAVSNAPAEPPAGADAADSPHAHGIERIESAAVAGSRPLRAREGPGIQGHLWISGAELPGALRVQGRGLARGALVEVEAGGWFALPEARHGERYVLDLPAGIELSESPNDQSVAGSGQVHVDAPARLDLLAHAVPEIVRIELALPDGRLAAGLRLTGEFGGREDHAFTAVTDARGALELDLPRGGRWSRLSMLPEAFEGRLYDPVRVLRHELSAGGEPGIVRLTTAEVWRVLVTDAQGTPLAGVTVAWPHSCIASGADGWMQVRASAIQDVQFLHDRFVESRFVKELSIPLPGVAELRLVPKGSWLVTLETDGSLGHWDLRLENLPPLPGATDAENERPIGTYGGGHGKRSGDVGLPSCTIPNEDAPPECWFVLRWARQPVWYELHAFAPEMVAPKRIRLAPFAEHRLTCVDEDGRPVAGVVARVMDARLGRSDADGLLRFTAPPLLHRARLRLTGGFEDAVPTEWTLGPGVGLDCPATVVIPRGCRFEIEALDLEGRRLDGWIGLEQPQVPMIPRRPFASRKVGPFPPGLRQYRILCGEVSTVVWHDAASPEPLRVMLLATLEEGDEHGLSDEEY